MDKKQLTMILEAVLLANDNVSAKQMHVSYGINPKLAQAGIKLYEYLKTINIENEKTN